MNNENKLVLFLVDGLRPDGLVAADTPTMDSIMASGSYTLKARTVMPSSTLPCHMSLFYGVPPGRHGITTNTWVPQVRPVPGLIETIHQSGGVTASFFNWEQLRDISRPGSLDASFFLKNCENPGGVGDIELAMTVSSWMKENPFHFAFVYLGYTDIAGHDFGWMSEPYLKAIANADRCIATILDNLSESTYVVILSDHGGHAYTHGTDCAEDMTIPVLFKGEGFPTGNEINQPVQITDIAPTIASLFKIQRPTEWIGRVISFDR
jgi:predicted AlkP superfamily pyrophosphatase or phosphodiesterase